MVEARQDKGKPPHLQGAFGIWLSKRAVGMLEFPFRHELTYQTGGWRLDALEPGKLIARVGERREAFDVEEGDYLLSAGDDLYLALNREGRDANGRPLPPPDAEREQPKEQKKEQNRSSSAKGKTAKRTTKTSSSRGRAAQTKEG